MYQAMDPTTSTNTTEETRLSPILDQEEEDDDDFKTCSSSSKSERTSYSNITNPSSSSSSSELSEYFESEEEEEEEEEEDFNIVPLNLPTMVERENRKNIVKTLQGQADIITNWSLTTRESDGRSVWTLMDGKPYTFASKFHHNVIPTRSSTLGGGSSSNSSFISLSNNMKMGSSSLSSRLAALVDLSNEIDNDINDLSRISALSSSASTSSSSSSASSSAAASFNISSVTDEESKGLLDESASSAASGGAVEEDTSGIGSSMKEDGQKKGGVYPCKKCDTLLDNKYYWYKHMIMEHGREDRARNADLLFDCRFCGKQFGQKRSRDAHVKTHAYRNAQQHQQETSESSPSSSSSALMNQVTPV